MSAITRRNFALSMAAAPVAPLFDGSSLHGWSIQDGPESAFYVDDGAIVGSTDSGFPAWLRSSRRYENFDLTFEYFLKGWMDGGVYFSAPDHGFRKSSCGFKVSLFHQQEDDLRNNSAGAIFPYIAPKLVNVKNKGEWNTMRIRLDWPSLKVWSNGAVTHDLNVESVPELKHRLRSGYIGFETLSYPLRFRNIKIEALPEKQTWEHLYEQPSDISKWMITEPNEKFPPKFETLGPVLRGDGLGNLTTKSKYRDFELQMYIRGIRHHNGGIQFRSLGGRNHYEIQIHDVEEAHYPTGSLYFFKRAKYPSIEPERWYLFQLFVKDRWCLVRINGEDVLEYDKLEKLEPGALDIQAHQNGRWIEYKHIRIRPL
jgi:hypothetical protein